MTDYRRSNRELAARRHNWPAGALEACNAIEGRWPEWHPVWEPGSDGGSRARAGYYATRLGAPASAELLFAETAEALTKLVELVENERNAVKAANRRLAGLWARPTRTPRTGRH
jgi:hypothetical protein